MKKSIIFILFGLFLSFTVQVNGQAVDNGGKTTANIAGKKDGRTSKSSVVNAGKINLSNSSKSIASFEMTYKGANGTITLTSNSKNLTTEMKNAINGFTQPTKITFQNIMIYENSTPDRKERIEPFSLNLE